MSAEGGTLKAFTLNTGAVYEWDSFTSGSVNATLDLYNISGGSKLLFRCDSFHCLNHSVAFGSLDNVAFADIGGEVLADTNAGSLINGAADWFDFKALTIRADPLIVPTGSYPIVYAFADSGRPLQTWY